MRRPYVSIVIPTLNEQRNIKALISGIERIIGGYAHEIIVVDGNSRDRTVEIARRMGRRCCTSMSARASLSGKACTRRRATS